MLALAERCPAPVSGLGAFFGLGLTPAERQQQAAQRKQAALAKRTAAQQKRQQLVAQRKAKRAARVAGRNVVTSNPAAAERLNRSIQALQKISQNAVAAGTAALKSRDRNVKTRALQTMQSAIKTVGGALGPAQSPTNKLRGLGVIDPVTGIDDGTVAYDPYSDPNYQQQYQPGGYGQVLQPGLDPTGLTTGLVPGFGNPFGGSPFGSGMQAPRGCASGSSAPRCLIYQMAVDEQQQFYFVFSIMQQMYAQLLAIVQQLMQQLQYQQQQPGFPYQGYGPSPYDPYGQGQYGGAGPYPSPYGLPGSPYFPGGDTSAIPAGFDTGGPFDAGGSFIPNDITQVFPGPSGMMPIGQGPQQPTNIISSDSLPDGAGPATDEFGGGDAPVPSFTPAMPPPMPFVPSRDSSQSVSAGPNQPNIVVNVQVPGQSPYADPGLPAGENQGQPTLEPPAPGEVEAWAANEF